jgi:hypothetical protein
MENIFEKIQKEYQNSKDNFDDDKDEVFNKESYGKFYDLINNVILFFVINTYETYFLSLNEDFSLENFNEKISNVDKILTYLRPQLNIYWAELSEQTKSTDQLIVDLQDILKLDIIKHKTCLFKFIKNLSILIIQNISSMNIVDITNYNDAKEKIAKIAHAILIINKETGLEDEDEFDCGGCEYKTTENSKYFWN